MIKLMFAQLFLTLSLAMLSFAQTIQEKPILLDEFGAENHETLMALTDAAIISSKIDSSSKNSDARLKIRINGGVNKYYSTAYIYASRLSGYLRRNRGVESEKFSVDFCETDEEFKIRFFSYSASADQEFPKCRQELKFPETATLFDSIYSYYPKLSLIPADTHFFDIGPSEGEYSRFALDALSKLLKKQSASKAVVIGYLNANGKWNGEEKYLIKSANLDRKSELRKIFIRVKNLLIRNGIKPRQIQFIDGGYKNNSKKVEFWFIPPNGKIPKPTPDYLSLNRRNQDLRL